MGGYCAFNIWSCNKDELLVVLDGEFDMEDIRRILQLMETIEEDRLK
jgi:hypothetical protein